LFSHIFNELPMADEPPSPVWLEQVDGGRVEIQGTCSLGRAPSNQFVLRDEKVSRRHAIVHAQGQNEFWLVDLGSSNGTYINGRRVAQPIQLRDQDRIDIGQFRLVFRQSVSLNSARRQDTTTEKTIQDIKTCPCWLVVADIESSTLLSRRLSPDELPVVTGQWFSACEQIINNCGGSIDKFLGDGFLAFWHGKGQTADEVARALAELKKVQTSGELAFRVVAHYGRVYMGGLATLGGERLYGPEVNFIFRMERLASSLRQPCLLSEAARTQIQSQLPTTALGRHTVQGFDGDLEFFSF
jgi:adenylate cyclase